MPIPKSIEIVRDFVAKVLVAVAAFLILGCAAIALNLFNSFASARGLVPPPILSGLTYLEYFIFALDTLCFGCFLIGETIRFLRDVTTLLRSTSQ